MMQLKRICRTGAGVLLSSGLAARAMAQQDAATPTFLSQWGLILLGVVVLVVIILTAIIIIVQRRSASLRDMYIEAEAPRSKFEQLDAEVQGLLLRVKGGESKGYYRKIERLLRVFLERTGHTDARHLSDEELEHLLSTSHLNTDQIQRLQSIFERCKAGAEHESEKLDFTAAELLRDLQNLVREADQASFHPEP